MTQQSFTLIKGRIPLLISMPHNGSEIPNEIQERMTDIGLSSTDTDWFMDKLYDFAIDLGAYILMPKYSRYAIDLNRDPSGANLYPGAQSTELCPTTSFSSQALYLPNKQPTNDEIKRRIEAYWLPYHSTIAITLRDLQEQFGKAVLFEAHSIASRVPRFFEGQLPDFNFGTNDGLSCSPVLINALENIDFAPYSQVTNGRFKGGFITRAYADVDNQIHSLQLELSQRTYLNEETLAFDNEKAQQVKKKLYLLVETLIDFSLQTNK